MYLHFAIYINVTKATTRCSISRELFHLFSARSAASLLACWLAGLHSLSREILMALQGTEMRGEAAALLLSLRGQFVVAIHSAGNAASVVRRRDVRSQ